MNRIFSAWLCLCFSGMLFLHAQPKPADTPEFPGLQWRNIGPFRGGRSVAVTGVTTDPLTYYMGTTGGGVWKTTDAGISWINISDNYFKTGTVGAIAVAPSDPNVIYAGMGEHAVRGVMTSSGDGVYRSLDAGKTWSHIGLDDSRHIADVIVHPQDPQTVYVAVQGSQYGASEVRGVYRSTNGGDSWERLWYTNEHTGAASLVMDPSNPRILYVAMWQHQRYPWTMESGGKHSGIFKTIDGGLTWTPVKKGLPENIGKSGITVSRANPERLWAVIEAEGTQGGVYRSDDAGLNWTQVNKDRINIARSWYYMEIFADPTDQNTVYVLNAPMLISIDGGITFKPVSTPHGDNHDLWINPENNQVMINANDGGANISMNGGRSWSAQNNQPTAQFYRVITDQQFPYNVYGGQQDNSAIAIASRTRGRGIDGKDWYSVAGCESAFIAFDPIAPEDIYGGCYQGIIERWEASGKTAKSIKAYPELGLGNEPKDMRFRYNWNAPILYSKHYPNTIYHAGNVVFMSADRGENWSVISKDLTRNEKDKQGPGGHPFTNEAAGGENYNTITYLAESPQQAGVLWAGTDDGLLHLTTNNGKTWTGVTPKEIRNGIINSIEISLHDPSTVYITLLRYKQNDLSPYIYKTTNNGKSWTPITKGIDAPHTFVRVVREDHKIKDLLYAGTETGLYISPNGGKQWERLQLNLPAVPINDLTINSNDLIAATAGRGFWILDDLGALQQSLLDTPEKLTIYQPKDTYLYQGGRQEKFTPGLGQNPSSGVTFDYYIPKGKDTLDLKLQVLDVSGKVMRSYSNKEIKDFTSWPGGPSKPKTIPSDPGFNRFTWDFRKDAVPAVEKVFVYGDYSGNRVIPGIYTLKLSAPEYTTQTTVKILADPNIEANTEAYREQERFLDEVDGLLSDIHRAVNQMRSARKQLLEHKNALSGKEAHSALLQKADSLITSIDIWESTLIQPQQKTFQDVINFNNKLNAELMYLRDYAASEDPTLTSGARERLHDLKTQWARFEVNQKQLINNDLRGFNQLYEEKKIPAIIINN